MHDQARFVGVGDQAGVFQGVHVLQACAVFVGHHGVGDDLGLPRADAVGIGFDLGQACRGLHGSKGAGVAGQCPAVGAAADEGPLVAGDVAHRAVFEVVVVAVDQLYTLGLHTGLAQVLQAGRVKTLDVDGRAFLVEVVFLQQGQHGVFKRVGTAAAAVGNGLLVVPVRVFGLGVNGDGAVLRLAFGGGDVDHVLHADQGQLAVPFGGTVGAVVQGGASDPVAQLLQGEVADRPVIGVVFAIHHQGFEHGFRVARIDLVRKVLRRAAGGGSGVFDIDQHALGGAFAGGDFGVGFSYIGDIGAVAQPGVVAGYQLTVARHVHVQLQHVGASVGGLFVGHARLLGVQGGVTAVGNDLRFFTV